MILFKIVVITPNTETCYSALRGFNHINILGNKISFRQKLQISTIKHKTISQDELQYFCLALGGGYVELDYTYPHIGESWTSDYKGLLSSSIITASESRSFSWMESPLIYLAFVTNLSKARIASFFWFFTLVALMMLEFLCSISLRKVYSCNESMAVLSRLLRHILRKLSRYSIYSRATSLMRRNTRYTSTMYILL